MGDHPFQVFGDVLWLGHRVGAIALPRLRFASDFVVGLAYWLGCHAVNTGCTLGMAAAGVRLVRTKRPSVRLHWPRVMLRYLVEFLSASAAQRWQWWVIIDLAFLYIYRGGQYVQDVLAGTSVLSAGVGATVSNDGAHSRSRTGPDLVAAASV